MKTMRVLCLVLLFVCMLTGCRKVPEENIITDPDGTAELTDIQTENIQENTVNEEIYLDLDETMAGVTVDDTAETTQSAAETEGIVTIPSEISQPDEESGPEVNSGTFILLDENEGDLDIGG